MWSAIIMRGALKHNNAYITAVTEDEHQSRFALTKDTPYLTFTGELWGVCSEHFFFSTDRIITPPRYNLTAL